MSKDTTAPAASAEALPPPSLPPRVDSAQLFKGASLLEIDHAGQRYVLRVTRENKLILTK